MSAVERCPARSFPIPVARNPIYQSSVEKACFIFMYSIQKEPTLQKTLDMTSSLFIPYRDFLLSSRWHGAAPFFLEQYKAPLIKLLPKTENALTTEIRNFIVILNTEENPSLEAISTFWNTARIRYGEELLDFSWGSLANLEGR